MTSIVSKVRDKIPKKKNSLDQSIQIMDKLLDRVNFDNLPSAEEQLKDI